MRKTLTKKQKLELELMAIKLWFQAFGKIKLYIHLNK